LPETGKKTKPAAQRLGGTRPTLGHNLQHLPEVSSSSSRSSSRQRVEVAATTWTTSARRKGLVQQDQAEPEETIFLVR
jgi:hypothetical protein